MPATDRSASGRPAGIRLLVADDDDGVRAVFATLLRQAAGVASVIEAKDGAEAVELASGDDVDLAVLDLNMPRLDGVEAVQRLRASQPSLLVALHSSDPELLRRRADALGLPLFDKVDFERLVEWVERQAHDSARAVVTSNARVAPMGRKLDLCCSMCGYGIVSRRPPERCPMCGGDVAWVEPSGWTSRRAALHERLAG